MTAGASVALTVPAVVAAGAVEGSLLGAAQATVLRRCLPDLRVGRWVVATAAGAVIAYAIGMSPSTLADLGVDVPAVLLFGLGPALALALLFSIGTAQWIVLRNVVRPSAAWIVITAGAWAAGLGVFLGFAMPLWHPGQAMRTIVVIGIAGGLLMAATTSAITGYGMLALLRRSHSRGATAERRGSGERRAASSLPVRPGRHGA